MKKIGIRILGCMALLSMVGCGRIEGAIERGKISYVYMEVNKVFVGRCQNIKICTKLKKHNQPNEEICKI